MRPKSQAKHQRCPDSPCKTCQPQFYPIQSRCQTCPNKELLLHRLSIIANDSISVDVKGLVDMTNKCFSRCNTPWSHINHSDFNLLPHNSQNFITNASRFIIQTPARKKTVLPFLNNRLVPSPVSKDDTFLLPQIKGSPQVKSKRVHDAPSSAQDVTRRTTEGSSADLVAILSANPLKRTQKENIFCYNQLRLLDIFSKITDATLLQLAGVVNVLVLDTPNHVVFSQGDAGTTWFVVLSGILHVSVNCVLVNTLHSGMGFGELALITIDGRRLATVISATPSVLLCIDKKDYNRIIKYEHKKDRHEKKLLLRQIPATEALTDIEQASICDGMNMKMYSKGAVLIRESETIQSVWIVKKGRISVWKNLEANNVMVKVGILNPSDYFGEIKVRKQNTTELSLVELRCDSTVELACISELDAYHKLPKSLPQSQYQNFTQNVLYNDYIDHVCRQGMLRNRRRYLDSLVRERFKNPGITQKGYRTCLSVGQFTGCRVTI